MTVAKNGSRFEWLFRGVLAIGVALSGGLAWESGQHTDRIAKQIADLAKVEQRIADHLDTHPDAMFTERIDSQRLSIRELEIRLRLLEIRLGVDRREE